jgi:hypothetical protein
MSLPRRHPSWPLLVGLGLAGITAFVLTLVATAHGLGQYPDSAVYVGTARNLLDGRGLTTPFNLQFNPYAPHDAVALYGQVPLTTFPPLYPLLLAAGGAFGLALTDVARILDAALFAATVVMIGVVAMRITRTTTVAVLSAFASVLSINLLINHTLLMADPLVLVAALGAFLLLPRLLRRPTVGLILAVGAWGAVASLSRFAGVALAATIVVATLCWGDEPFRRRVRTALMVGAVSITPLLVWIVATRLTSSRTAELRPVGWHFMTGSQTDTILRVSASWVAGAGPTESVTTSVVVLVVLVLVLVGLGIALAARRQRTIPPVATDHGEPEPTTVAVIDDDWRDSDRLLGALAVYVVMSLLALWATATFFDASIPLEGRLLLPIQLGAVLLVPGLLYRALRAWSTAAVACVVTSVFLVFCAWPWRTVARGYGTTTTAQLLADGWPAAPPSALGVAVGKLPPDALVAANFPATIYQNGGHDSVFVPPRWDLIAGHANRDVDRQLAELGRILARRRGYLALYTDSTKLFASEAQIRNAMALQTVGTFSDGTLYRVTGTPAP